MERTTKNSEAVKFSKRIIINCSSVEVFDYTQNYENRLKWDTFLKKAELMDDATKTDKGIKAYCVAKNGLGMVTEYVSFNRPKATAIKMTHGPYMFKNFLVHGHLRRKTGSRQRLSSFIHLSFAFRSI